MSFDEKLVPTLDHAASADYALERFAPLPGGIEHRAIFQGAGVLGGDQRALDHGFAVAQADVCDLQFVVAHGVLIEGVKGWGFPRIGWVWQVQGNGPHGGPLAGMHTDPIVGAGLPAKAVCQSLHLCLHSRFRRQASSHN